MNNYRPVWWLILVVNLLQLLGIVLDRPLTILRLVLSISSAVTLIVVAAVLLSRQRNE